jgi:hypothetical protein
MRRWLALLGLVLLIGLFSFARQAAWPTHAAGTISLTGGAYTQNFDTLANTGASSTVPNGWDFLETGSNANTSYTASSATGATLTGDTYSLGATSASERAFGGVQSGSLNPTIGAAFVNNTGSAIGEITLTYTGEQWRLGATGRADRLDFQLSADATSLNTGTWVDYNALDFASPVTGGTVGGLDGNASPNRTAITATVSGLNIPNGATFWIRWTDFNASGADDALSVDDLALTAGVAVPRADITALKTGPLSAQPGGALTYTLTLSNSGDLTATTTIVTDTLPAGVNFVTYTTTLPHTFSQPAPDTLVWQLGDVAPSAAGLSLTIYSTVASTVTLNSTITNTLTAATTATETITANNSASAATFIGTLCSGVYTPTYAIQGAGASTPYSGTVITTQGVVVGDFQSATQLNGFYIQDTTGDGLTQTSDGLFVYAPGSMDITIGDLVRVTGTATEFFSITEVGFVTNLIVCDSGPSAAPTAMPLPVPTYADFERFEGMLVTFPQTLTVDQNYFLGRYGQLTLSGAGRLYHPNNGTGLGDTAEYNQRRMLILDDGSSAQNPNPIPYLGLSHTVRAGDVVVGLIGVLDYGLITSDSTTRHYKLNPTQPVSITRVNHRAPAPASVGGNVRVASFNVLNYFNGDGQGGGFPTSRGASTLAEFNRQRAKIITALVALNGDVVGLMEMENDGLGQFSAMQDLVNGLNAQTSPDTYTFTVAPAPGSDEIKVALLYQPSRVTPVGAAQNYQVTTHPTYTPLFDRPPLAQTFVLNTTGETFTVIVNHFKSKGSCPASGVDLDYGQGCWNAKRTAQATALLTFITQMQASANDPDVLVIGDLNSYGVEDPIVTLTNGGLVNEAAHWIPAEDRYSYVFDGAAGYLDHVLATASLHAQTIGATHWHINADEPLALDYNQEFNPPELYFPDAYRASDHDPALLGLNLVAPHQIYLPLVRNGGALLYEKPPSSPIYPTNYANTAGCNWLGIAGQVFNANGQPLTGVLVHLESPNLHVNTLTGAATQYGAGYYEFVLGAMPVVTTATYRVQLLSLNGNPLSALYTIPTLGDCAKNLVLVNFRPLP